MFGLVKASRLRKAESERDEWKQFSGSHAEQAAKDIRWLIKHRDNWFAVAESRLVAVLLLRERLVAAKSSVQEIAKALTETALAVADKAQERDNALQENARLQQCWTTNVVVAEERTPNAMPPLPTAHSTP